jgi:hypothetical protein
LRVAVDFQNNIWIINNNVNTATKFDYSETASFIFISMITSSNSALLSWHIRVSDKEKPQNTHLGPLKHVAVLSDKDLKKNFLDGPFITINGISR